MKVLCFISVVVLFVAACNPLKQITFAEHQPFDEKKISDSIRMEFNGIANFYIQYKGSAVLTDPFMSNPSAGKVMFGKIKPNIELIESFNPKTYNIKLLSIGHAHYDHIFDLPYFIPHLSNTAKIVGSHNAIVLANTLKAQQECINIDEIKATAKNPGTWVYAADSTVRIMATQSAHLPHLLGISLYHGKYDEALSSYPVKAKKFKQDETYAFLIDFLNPSHQPEKRIYFSSSAVNFPNGYFPQEVLNQKPVDVAIISVALLQKVKNYPEHFIKYLKPAVTIPCHWENFFRTREKKLKPVSMTRHKKLFTAAEALKDVTDFQFIKPGNSWKAK
jgi:L-ascorbate metabolism protein UlaG (beta-lactamase superfamily)